MLVLVVATALALIALAPVAHAGNDSRVITNQATVSNSCTVSSATLAFGTYNPVGTHLTTDLTASSGFTVNCTLGALTTIELTEGLHEAAGSTPAAPLRQLASGANRLTYALYQNAARTLAWGSGTSAESSTGTGANSTVTVYGTIPKAQNRPSGAYGDTVTATINF